MIRRWEDVAKPLFCSLHVLEYHIAFTAIEFGVSRYRTLSQGFITQVWFAIPMLIVFKMNHVRMEDALFPNMALKNVEGIREKVVIILGLKIRKSTTDYRCGKQRKMIMVTKVILPRQKVRPFSKNIVEKMRFHLLKKEKKWESKNVLKNLPLAFYKELRANLRFFHKYETSLLTTTLT